jgi:branched-chain amino acid transport system permease protein
MALSLNLVNSQVGRTLRALHASEVASESVGIDTKSLKLAVFALSAAYAGLAGGLHATYLGFMSPSSFGIGVSIELVVMAVVGGLANIWGALFGATTVLIIQQYVSSAIKVVIPQASGEYEVIAFGLILIVIMIFTPAGLFSTLTGAARRWHTAPTAIPTAQPGKD